MEKREEIVLAVAAVITDTMGRVLLSRCFKPSMEGRWHCPGGIPQFGENLNQALRRELRATLGLEIEVTTAQPVFISQTVVPRENRHIVCLFYKARILSGGNWSVQGTGRAGYFGEAEIRHMCLPEGCRDFLIKNRGWHL
jgi:ADP-ribose pyrophosphatase YjhB (NUDIX family)